MSFWGDERSQSVQVGAIILFGFLVIGISSYQVTVVPSQNEGIEFNHNQRVTDEMSDVRNAIIQTGENGGTQPQSITLGTSFPSRTLFVNPPPATGQIQTVGTTKESYNVTITNGTAQSREVAHFWNGSQKTFPTGLLIYEPNYREFTGAGNVTYGHSLLYKKFDNGNAITLTDQSIVEGRTISLVMLNGSLSESGVGSYTVRPRGLSVSKTTVTLRSDDIVNITLPTRLSESKWRETVGDENSVYLNYTNLGDRQFDLVNISLKPDTTYELRLAKVGVGNLPSDAEQDTGPAYITDVEGLSDSLRNNSEDRVVVEVRDKYNNPVSGVQVNVTTDENATVKNVTETGADGLATQTTDAEGRVTVLVTPNATDANVTVNASIFDGDDPPENVTFEATTQAAPNAGGGGGGGGNATGSWPIWWTNPKADSELAQDTTNLTLSPCSNTSCAVNAGETDQPLILKVTTDEQTNGATVTYGVNNTSVATLNESSDFTASDGNDTVELKPKANQTVVVSATSGGTTTTIEVTFTNVVPSGPAPAPATAFITAVEPDPDKLADSSGEFIRLYIPSGVNTTGWTLEDGDRSTSISSDLDGVVYFAADETAFEDQWNLPGSQVLGTSIQLNNNGETVELLDSGGAVVDRFAYGGGSETFADGSSFTFGNNPGSVANRTSTSGNYVDTDGDGDWTEEDECVFFDGGDGCSAQNTEISGTPTASGGSGKVSFDLTNNGDTAVTIVSINFKSTSASAVDRIEANGGTAEFRTTGTDLLNAVIPLGDSRDLDTDDTIPAGGTHSYDLDRFVNSGGNKVNMNGESVTLLLTFSNGDIKEITLNF
jgi:hypothetical protein